MGRTGYHVHISVRGALLNWSEQEFDGVFSYPDGRKMTPREAKAALLDELAKGHEVLPCSDDCEGFDPAGKGCPGHAVPEEAEEFGAYPLLHIPDPDPDPRCPRCEKCHTPELPCAPADDWSRFGDEVTGVGV